MATNTHISVRGAQRRTVVVLALATTARSGRLRQDRDQLERLRARRSGSLVPLAGQALRPAAPGSRELRRSADGLQVVADPPRRSRGRLLLLVAPRHRHLGAGRVAGLPGRFRHGHVRERRVVQGRLRRRAGLRVLAHQPVVAGRRARRRATGPSSATSTRGSGHVHLTELDGDRCGESARARPHRAVSRTRRRPRVTSISFRHDRDGPRRSCRALIRGRRPADRRGAEDAPTIERARRLERHARSRPRCSRWQIRSWTGKRRARPPRSRSTSAAACPTSSFWRVYARGTYQNMALSRATLLVGTARARTCSSSQRRPSTADGFAMAPTTS